MSSPITRDDVQVRLRLVPVEFTGICPHEGCMVEHGDAAYGLSDAVESWSGCNRAIGQIYRVEDLPVDRLLGDSVEVWVNQSDLPWFERKFGDDA